VLNGPTVLCEVEEDKITATYKKREITVVLSKATRQEAMGKRIPVTKGKRVIVETVQAGEKPA